MKTVDDIIKSYNEGCANDDKIVISRALEDICGIDIDKKNWDHVFQFCEKNSQNAILEIITRKYINTVEVAEFKPYAVLSNLHKRARDNKKSIEVLKSYYKIYNNNKHEQWEFLEALYNSGLDKDCLDITSNWLNDNPLDFKYIAMECKIFLRRSDKKRAKSSLGKMRNAIGLSAANWIWYAALASAMGNSSESKRALISVIDLLNNKSITISSAIIHFLLEEKFIEDCRKFIGIADPLDYTDINEIKKIFEYAYGLAIYDTALKFGYTLVELCPDTNISEKIKNIEQFNRMFSEKLIN